MTNQDMRSPAAGHYGIELPRAGINKLTPKQMGFVAFVTAVSLARVVSPSIRDVLPEPIDAPDHIGNFGPTMAIALHFSDGFWKKSKAQAMTPAEHHRRRRIYAGVVGVMTVAANVVAEKFGYGPISTPDEIDFVYGCLGGFAAYRLMRPDYIKPEDVATAYKHSHREDAVFAQTIDNVFARTFSPGPTQGKTSNNEAASAAIDRKPVKPHVDDMPGLTRKDRRKVAAAARKANRNN